MATKTLFILFYVITVVGSSSSCSSSVSSNGVSRETLIDMIRKLVTYNERDPRLDYLIPDVIFTIKAKRSPREEIEGPNPELFLGSGKYGGVYLAQSKRDSNQYAVKLVPLVSSYRAKCAINELIIASSEGVKRGPFLTPIKESYFYKEKIFLIMPLVVGEPLNRASWSEHIKAPSDIFRLCFQILSLVASIKDLKICHADISTSNFMLSKDGSVHLIDFGLAQQIISEFSSDTEDSDFMFTDSCSDERRAAELCLSIVKKAPSISKKMLAPTHPPLSALRFVCESIRAKKITIHQALKDPVFNTIKEAPQLRSNLPKVF
ncbi:hypothetical protein MDAP_001828 [Mitosporidium daphniae]